jgi:hypothetical protein
VRGLCLGFVQAVRRTTYNRRYLLHYYDGLGVRPRPARSEIVVEAFSTRSEELARRLPFFRIDPAQPTSGPSLSISDSERRVTFLNETKSDKPVPCLTRDAMSVSGYPLCFAVQLSQVADLMRGDASVGKTLTLDKARRIAANIAELPELLKTPA